MSQGINLKGALKNYYDNGGELTEGEIAELVFDDKVPARAASVLSQWKNGHHVDKARLKAKYINKLCDVLGCDPNFLFGYGSSRNFTPYGKSWEEDMDKRTQEQLFDLFGIDGDGINKEKQIKRIKVKLLLAQIGLENES